MALLAPDIVEAILAGRTDQALMMEQLEQAMPMNWEEQIVLCRIRGTAGGRHGKSISGF